MKKVSIITLSLVMLINSGVAFSANKKRIVKINANKSPIITTTPVNEVVVEEQSLEIVSITSDEEKTEDEKSKEINALLSTLNTNTEKVKNSCSGIKDDLKAIQVLAGVSTGASAVGTLTSGGALATGIIKNVKDKKIGEKEQQNNEIEKLLKMSDSDFSKAIVSGEVSRALKGLSDTTTKDDLKEMQTTLKGEINKDIKTSKTLGNARTGLMAGSIATSATSTITSGISAKKLDDLIDKMKECNEDVNTLKSSVNTAVAEEVDTDLTSYQDIVKSCSGFDTANIKEIKGVMTASTVVGGIGAATSIAGTITSALANTNKVRDDDSEKGVKKEKGLNLAANIMAGVSTGTSAGGIVLGAVTLNKLAKNVEIAEKCEDALK